jgi:hypothetical protein
MVIHVVLYRPKASLEKQVRAALIETVAMARDEIPQIRRFIVGRRLDKGPQYQLGNFPDLPFAAVLEFTDRDGLEGYLSHPRHEELARLFGTTVEAGLIYDYEAVDASAVSSLVDE